jgi:hypothetical protein
MSVLSLPVPVVSARGRTVLGGFVSRSSAHWLALHTMDAPKRIADAEHTALRP